MFGLFLACRGKACRVPLKLDTKPASAAGAKRSSRRESCLFAQVAKTPQRNAEQLGGLASIEEDRQFGYVCATDCDLALAIAEAVPRVAQSGVASDNHSWRSRRLGGSIRERGQSWLLADKLADQWSLKRKLLDAMRGLTTSCSEHLRKGVVNRWLVLLRAIRELIGEKFALNGRSPEPSSPQFYMRVRGTATNREQVTEFLYRHELTHVAEDVM